MKHFIKYIAGFSIAAYIGLLVLSLTNHSWIKQKLQGHKNIALVVADRIIEPIESLPQIVDEVITNHVEHTQEDDNVILNTESVELPEYADSNDGNNFRNDLMVVDMNSDSLFLDRTKKKLERIHNSWTLFKILEVHVNNIQQLSKEEKPERKVNAR